MTKITLIMGAGEIGKAVEVELLKRNHTVLMASRTSELKCDVTNENDVKNTIKTVINRFGKIDNLIYTAAINTGNKTMLETSSDEYNRIFDTNVRGCYYTMKYVIPYMKKQKSGIIINISSVLGIHTVNTQSVYTASKFAVTGLSKVVAKETKGAGIKIYVFCPGAAETRMYRKAHPNTPSWKIMKPEKVAKKIVKLCDGTKKTGSIIRMYGPNELYGITRLWW